MPSHLSYEDKAAAEAALLAIAPNELPYLRQLMTARPWRDRLHGGSVGYGLESDVSLFAPYVLLAATWARSVVVDESRQIIEKRLRALTRRFFGVKEQVAPPERPTDSSDPQALREAVTVYAVLLGCDGAKARLLADAVVAAVLVPRE